MSDDVRNLIAPFLFFGTFAGLGFTALHYGRAYHHLYRAYHGVDLPGWDERVEGETWKEEWDRKGLLDKLLVEKQPDPALDRVRRTALYWYIATGTIPMLSVLILYLVL